MQIDGKYKLILTNKNNEILDTYELEGMDLDEAEISYFSDQIVHEIKTDMEKVK